MLGILDSQLPFLSSTLYLSIYLKFKLFFCANFYQSKKKKKIKINKNYGKIKYFKFFKFLLFEF